MFNNSLTIQTGVNHEERKVYFLSWFASVVSGGQHLTGREREAGILSSTGLVLQPLSRVEVRMLERQTRHFPNNLESSSPDPWPSLITNSQRSLCFSIFNYNLFESPFNALSSDTNHWTIYCENKSELFDCDSFGTGFDDKGSFSCPDPFGCHHYFMNLLTFFRFTARLVGEFTSFNPGKRLIWTTKRLLRMPWFQVEEVLSDSSGHRQQRHPTNRVRGGSGQLRLNNSRSRAVALILK